MREEVDGEEIVVVVVGASFKLGSPGFSCSMGLAIGSCGWV